MACFPVPTMLLRSLFFFLLRPTSLLLLFSQQQIADRVLRMTLGWAAKGAFATSNLYSFTIGDGYECVTGVDAVEERVKEEEPDAEERDGDGGQAHPRGVPLSPPTLQRAHAGLGARLGRVREEKE
uniref:Uncharacterized protein n=1 Tax=Oryza glumipatula TaxID=40148 RepID=A0A0E0AUJ1_9ORYZ